MSQVKKREERERRVAETQAGLRQKEEETQIKFLVLLNEKAYYTATFAEQDNIVSAY